MVQMRLASGEVVHRSIRQLSGGERRRVALALGLGFSELAARRGRFSCNLLVLDEVHVPGDDLCVSRRDTLGSGMILVFTTPSRCKGKE